MTKLIVKLTNYFILYLVGAGLAGCSTILFQNTLNPEKGEKWEITNQRSQVGLIFFAPQSYFYKKNPAPDGASYQCDSSRIQVYPIDGFGFSFVGPPIIPFIPVWSNGATTVHLNLVDPSPWGVACPSVKATTDKTLPLKLFAKRVDSTTNTYECRYRIGAEMSSAETLILSISHKSCEANQILYKRKKYWGYCAICIPPIGG